MFRIYLYLEDGKWVTRWTDNYIKLLFGTDIIPTSFTERTKPEVVLKLVQERNKGYEVILSKGRI